MVFRQVCIGGNDASVLRCEVHQDRSVVDDFVAGGVRSANRGAQGLDEYATKRPEVDDFLHDTGDDVVTVGWGRGGGKQPDALGAYSEARVITVVDPVRSSPSQRQLSRREGRSFAIVPGRPEPHVRFAEELCDELGVGKI
jgi:hypothetical protein